LQEVYDGRDPVLERRFRTFTTLLEELDYVGYDYEAEFMENRAEGLIPQGNAIFSRYPIKTRHGRFFRYPFDKNYVEDSANYSTISHNLQHVVLDTPAGDINFFNFHGVKDDDGDNDSKTRQMIVNVLLDEITGKENVIIVGDTNALPTNPSIKRLSINIKNLFGTSIPTTFNMKRKDNPGFATSVVDMIFASDNFEVLQKYVPDVDISDHLPIVARLKLT